MNYELYNNYKISFETPNDGYSYFFGYYDKAPLNFDNTKLLVHRVSFDGRDVQDGDIAELGYFDLNTNDFIKLDETLAWNWQQGSQLQWLPPKYNEEIIYNNIANNKFVSIIYNIKTEEKRRIPFPVYVVHPNGREALGINYERHYWCRPGYNYKNIKNTKWNLPYHPEDGIYKINLESGDVDLIISTKEIVHHQKLPEFERCNNWLEHMMYNPSGNRFMFFHRWHLDGVDHTRLFTAKSSDGKEIFMFPDTRFYSHADWKNNRELTIWSKEPESNENPFRKKLLLVAKKNIIAKKIIKPLFSAIRPLLSRKTVDKILPKSKLLNYLDQTHQYEVIELGISYSNGHFKWSDDNNYLLNDTYDDEKSYRHLMIYNLINKETEQVGKFYSQYNSCGFRADLHPRFNLSENRIIIDSAHNIKRKILIIRKISCYEN